MFWTEFEYSAHTYPCQRAIWLLKTLGGYDSGMANNGKRSASFAQIEFVQISLDKDAEKAFHKWKTDHEQTCVSDLGNFIAEEMKLGITWDTSNNCFIASATCKDAKSPNLDRCVTARSDDWLEALMLLVFKHTVTAAGGDWSAVSKPTAWG